jgi:hypothetical protein
MFIIPARAIAFILKPSKPIDEIKGIIIISAWVTYEDNATLLAIICTYSENTKSVPLPLL